MDAGLPTNTLIQDNMVVSVDLVPIEGFSTALAAFARAVMLSMFGVVLQFTVGAERKRSQLIDRWHSKPRHHSDTAGKVGANEKREEN
jgi:hypothetical protein